MRCGVCSYYVQLPSGRWSRHKRAEFVAGDGENNSLRHKRAEIVAGDGKNSGWRHNRAEFVAGDGENSNRRHKNADFVAGKGKNLTGTKLTGGELKGRKSDRKPLLAQKVAGLQKLGVKVVEEGGEEGVGEAEAVLPAVVPPAGGLDPEGVEEGSVFLVLVRRMKDLGEDAVDQGGVCLNSGKYRRVKAQVTDADRVEDVGETVHVFAPEDSVEPGPVDLVAVVLDEEEPVEELA